MRVTDVISDLELAFLRPNVLEVLEACLLHCCLCDVRLLKSRRPLARPSVSSVTVDDVAANGLLDEAHPPEAMPMRRNV